MPNVDEKLLAAGRAVTIDSRRSVRIEVRSGVVWITVGGSAEDLFVGPGGVVWLPIDQQVVAEPVGGAARVRLVGRARALPRFAAAIGRVLRQRLTAAASSTGRNASALPNGS